MFRNKLASTYGNEHQNGIDVMLWTQFIIANELVCDIFNPVQLSLPSQVHYLTRKTFS